MKVSELMTPQEWALGPGSTCKSLRNLELERLQIKFLEEDLPGNHEDSCHHMVLGLHWMFKHFRHLTVLDLEIEWTRGKYDHESDSAMESNVLALRRGDGPIHMHAFRVNYRNQEGACIEELLDWLVARMPKLVFLDVSYCFGVSLGVFPAMANLKRLRLVMNAYLEARCIQPELLLLPNLEELCIFDNDIDCDYDVDDASFTARNFGGKYDLSQLSSLVRVGFDQMVTDRVCLPPGCRAYLRTPKLQLDNPLYMQKLSEDLIDAWTDCSQQLHHLVLTNEAPEGFDASLLQHFSSVRCLELNGNHGFRPSIWPKLEQFSEDLAQYNLQYLQSIFLFYRSKQAVTVKIVLPRSIPLKCLEVVTDQVMLSIEDPRAMGNTLEKIVIVGRYLNSKCQHGHIVGPPEKQGVQVCHSRGSVQE